MNYQSLTIWISVFLLLTILLMVLFPSQTMIGAGIILMPILVLIQVYVILQAQEPTSHSSTEDQWYEH